VASLSMAGAQAPRADALVVAVRRGRRGPQLLDPGLPGLADALPAGLDATLASLGATGKAEEVTRLPAPAGAGVAVLVAVGVGAQADPDADTLRRAAGAATRLLAGTRRVALALPADTVERVGAVAEGALLGAYDFTRFRTVSDADHKAAVRSLVLHTPLDKDRDARAAVTQARATAAAVHLVRDLVNTPAGHLHPADLAGVAEQVGAQRGLDVTVLDDVALAEQGYGGLTGVGQGAAAGPRLVRIAYRHPDARAHLALVGKGITFDTGGISLKPPQDMHEMKGDMAGAAAVIATLGAIADLGLVVNVTGWAALAENMPSSTAQRPGDVLTIRGGRTVEVLNTDAEGRLVLADALVDAAAEGPDLLIDVATLTGAAVVAMGTRTTAVMGNDDEARDAVAALGRGAGEPSWAMPLPEELRAGLNSQVADLANVSGRPGGMLAAGVFLGEFVPAGTRWVHLDIAGTAFTKTPHGYTPVGGTGVTVRTFVAVAQAMAAGQL